MSLAEQYIPTKPLKRSGAGRKVKARKGKKLPKVISQEDYEKLLAAINTKTKTGIRQMAIIETLYKTGVRNAELCDLAPADVDLVNGVITVQCGKYSKDRKISIGPALIETLSKYNNSRPQQDDYFFVTGTGQPLDTRFVRAMLERLSNKAGVFIQDRSKKRPVFPHALRSSCATNWLNSGLFNLREVQVLLGHEDLSTTQIYLGVSMPEIDKKIKALG